MKVGCGFVVNSTFVRILIVIRYASEYGLNNKFTPNTNSYV